jgi:hypothetical protein
MLCFSVWRRTSRLNNNHRILAKGYDTLYYPAAWLTVRRVWNAQQILLSRLRIFHTEHRESRINSTAHRLNVVAMSDPVWEENPDYYLVELLMSLAIIPTMSTITVWLMRHLLAQPHFLNLVVSEIEQLRRDQGSKPSTDEPVEGKTADCVDLTSLNTTCPRLVESWHETLRLHMSGIPRAQFGETSISPFHRQAARYHSVPVISFSYRCARPTWIPEVWGPDYQLFNPGRFINTEGKLSVQMTRRVRGFGMPGNLCPGR